MKKHDFSKPLCRLVMAVAMMMLSLQAMAFSYTYQGKTLYYEITSDNTVKVTNYYYDVLAFNDYVNGDVVIPNSVEYNGVTYSVTSIGETAFYGCSGLTSVSIPNSVTSIGWAAFWVCSGLSSINVASGNTHYSSIDGVLYNYVQDTLIQCPGAKTSVTIPNGVTFIGWAAFFGCSSLTSVTIPNSVTSIREGAFEGCSGLTSVTIPNSVTSIGDTAFKNCSSLTSVTIPNSVTSIGNSAFYGCSSLTSVSIPSNITSIKNGTFYGCSSLTSVTIPNSVTSIGDTAFKNCSGLVSVVIGDGITNIGRNLFGDCPYLTYLTIGRSVESIENGAFLNCSLLSQITSWASVPPEIGGIDAFPHPNNCTVTVPCGSLGAYTEQTNRWNLLFNGRISEGLSFGLSVSANDEAYGRVEVETQSCNVKTLTAIANEGYEFTAWSDGNMENPRTVTLTNDTAFTAIFTETETTPTITVTVNDATMGSATYTMDGNTAVLTATANEGYSFVIWNDGNTENPRTVTITSDTAFMAIFTASGSSSLQAVNAREFALYPNPAKSFVTLEFEALDENTLLQIFDINGRRVRTLDLKAGVETLRIDLGDLPKGVYTIMVGNATKKLIVE